MQQSIEVKFMAAQTRLVADHVEQQVQLEAKCGAGRNAYQNREAKKLQTMRNLRTTDELFELDTRSYAENYDDLTQRMGASPKGIQDYFDELADCKRAEQRLQEIVATKNAKMTSEEITKRNQTLVAEKTEALQQLAA